MTRNLPPLPFSWLVVLMAVLFTACATPPSPTSHSTAARAPFLIKSQEADNVGQEILMYTLGLLDIGYRFGGKNPEAGLDCSGLVSYIYFHAIGMKLPHNAARIARLSRPINRDKMRIGDLVFFNTLNRNYSHMGIYIGQGQFVHAPRSNSTIRIDRLDNRYFAARFNGAHTLFD